MKPNRLLTALALALLLLPAAAAAQTQATELAIEEDDVSIGAPGRSERAAPRPAGGAPSE